MDTLLDFLQNKGWLAIATSLVALASAIAAITPTPKKGSTWAKAYAVLDWVALNFVFAKDKGDKEGEK